MGVLPPSISRIQVSGATRPSWSAATTVSTTPRSPTSRASGRATELCSIDVETTDADFAPIALDSEDTALDHTDHCGCRDCDPDAALDAAAELRRERPDRE